MSEKTAYENTSLNYVFSVYYIINPNDLEASCATATEVMMYNNEFWYIDNGYDSAIENLLLGNGWISIDHIKDSIGEFKFSFTLESHPEFFI